MKKKLLNIILALAVAMSMTTFAPLSASADDEGGVDVPQYTNWEVLPTGSAPVVEGPTSSQEVLTEAPSATTVNVQSPVLLLQAKDSGKKTIALSWNKVSGANKYVVYAAKCGKDFKKVTSTKSAKLTLKKASGKKLKNHNEYKMYVIAYKGSSKIVKSKNIHFILGETKGKYANATSVTVNAKSATVQAGNTYKIKASYKIKKGKKHLGNSHGAAISYYSNNKKVAKVSSKGIVTAVSVGQATIYVQDLGGKYAKVKITVTKSLDQIKEDAKKSIEDAAGADASSETKEIMKAAFELIDGLTSSYEVESKKQDAIIAILNQKISENQSTVISGGGGGGGPSQPDPQQEALTKAQNDAKAQIEEAIKAETSEEVQKIAEEFIANLDSLESEKEIQDKLKDTLALIKAQIEKEKAELAAAIAKAKSDINAALKQDASQKVKDIASNAISDIESLTTVSDVNKALQSALTAIHAQELKERVPVKGHTISILNTKNDGSTERLKYRVLDINGMTAKLLALDTDSNMALYKNSSVRTNFSAEGKEDLENLIKYEGSDLDKYLNETYYNKLSFKNAIIPQTIYQGAYDLLDDMPENGDYWEEICAFRNNYTQWITDDGYKVYVGQRYVYAPDVSDILEYLKDVKGTLAAKNINKLFYNIESGKNLNCWLRSAGIGKIGSTVCGIYIYGTDGAVSLSTYDFPTHQAKAMFTIDLSKCDWENDTPEGEELVIDNLNDQKRNAKNELNSYNFDEHASSAVKNIIKTYASNDGKIDKQTTQAGLNQMLDEAYKKILTQAQNEVLTEAKDIKEPYVQDNTVKGIYDNFAKAITDQTTFEDVWSKYDETIWDYIADLESDGITKEVQAIRDEYNALMQNAPDDASKAIIQEYDGILTETSAFWAQIYLNECRFKLKVYAKKLELSEEFDSTDSTVIEYFSYMDSCSSDDDIKFVETKLRNAMNLKANYTETYSERFLPVFLEKIYNAETVREIDFEVAIMAVVNNVMIKDEWVWYDEEVDVDEAYPVIQYHRNSILDNLINNQNIYDYDKKLTIEEIINPLADAADKEMDMAHQIYENYDFIIENYADEADFLNAYCDPYAPMYDYYLEQILYSSSVEGAAEYKAEAHALFSKTKALYQLAERFGDSQYPRVQELYALYCTVIKACHTGDDVNNLIGEIIDGLVQAELNAAKEAKKNELATEINGRLSGEEYVNVWVEANAIIDSCYYIEAIDSYYEAAQRTVYAALMMKNLWEEFEKFSDDLEIYQQICGQIYSFADDCKYSCESLDDIYSSYDECRGNSYVWVFECLDNRLYNTYFETLGEEAYDNAYGRLLDAEPEDYYDVYLEIVAEFEAELAAQE